MPPNPPNSASTATSGGLDPRDGDPDEPWAPPTETGAVSFPYTAYKCGYPIRQVSPSKPATVFHDAAAGAAPEPKNLHLTIAGNAATSVVVQWSTDTTTKQTEVRFGDAPDRLDKIAHGYSFTAGSRREHEVHLCALKPSKTYYYDAGGDAGRSRVYKFTTAPDDASEVTILVSGDTRSDPSKLGSFAATARTHGPTMMLMSGDAVASGGEQSQWDELFAAAPDLFAELPTLWANGNHEALDELYFAQFALPDHRATTTQIEEWYATTYGPIRFVVLNDTVSNNDQITGSEKQFLQATLQSVDRTRTPFVVSMHHQPMYTASLMHGPNTKLRSEWGPLLARYKVNADIAGHVHSYESSKPLLAGTTTVTTEAIGTRFFNFGGGGAPLYEFNPFGLNGWLQTKEKTNGFAILKASSTSMTWSAFRADGSAIEAITMPRQ